MNPEIFAEWHRRRGTQVLRTESSWWHQQGPRAYQAFPYHWVITPAEAELRQFMWQYQALALRYSTPMEAATGYMSYHAVYEGNDYDISQLGKWARKNIRHGLKTCGVEEISFTDLAREGLALQLDTLNRQGRSVPATQKWWDDLTMGAADLPGFRAWAARVEGKLAASVITFQMDDTIYMLYQQCLRQYLPLHVNNALGYEVTKQVLTTEGVKGILYGLHSLDAPASVDEFKFRMGYHPKPVRQRVLFHPLASPFMNNLSHKAIRLIQRYRPNQPTLAKLEGMLRFYLEGLRDHSQQTVPLHLRNAVSDSEDQEP